jgi:hypothetical protein
MLSRTTANLPIPAIDYNPSGMTAKGTKLPLTFEFLMAALEK